MCVSHIHDILTHDIPCLGPSRIYPKKLISTVSWHTIERRTPYLHCSYIRVRCAFHIFTGYHVRMYHVSAYTLFHLRLFLQLTHIPATCVFRGFMTYRPRMYPISVLYEYTYNWLLPHIHGIVTSDIPCFCMLTIYSKTVFLAVSWHTVSRCTPNLRILNIPWIRVFHIFMTYSLMIYLDSAC